MNFQFSRLVSVNCIDFLNFPELIDTETSPWYIFKDKLGRLAGVIMQKKVILACVECGSRNYTTNSNKETQVRLELRKYCSKCDNHTIHRETK